MMSKQARADIQATLAQIAGDLEKLNTTEKLWTTRQAVTVEHLRYALKIASEALPKSDRPLVRRLLDLTRVAPREL